MQIVSHEETVNELLEFAKDRAGKYYFAFAFGMLTSILTDEQWEDLQAKLDRNTLFGGEV